MEITAYIQANYLHQLASVTDKSDILTLAKMVNLEDNGELDGYTFNEILNAIHELITERL